MADLSLVYGGDLAIGATGDLAISTGSALTEQRVLRRLLTNPDDYIWQLSYGAGLGRFVGAAGAAGQIAAVARAQLHQETRVAQTPLPRIGVNHADPSGIAMTIDYRDAMTGQSVALTLPG
ncbi:hypothetical protein AiwAL_04655 [Acidiphilium sp. AL]|uniref:Phage tail protein n=1 Tax=Acidiphilium iwatense TaxID=768198 RepID=A0ABS9DV15_9PROT|nr:MULTISPECIES: hypothetical protein [Acidiphilium]MCF3945312.1 hypothetical protein [Acidiphilium iwatense]MCU4159394.1 hypothetical protein [Acidiphilium sp. AL]